MICSKSQMLALALGLLAMQVAAASRRVPLQAVNAVQPTNNQHVQFTVAMKGVTCAQLPALNTQPFTDRFRGQMRLDIINYLTAQGQTQAIATIKSASDSCADITFQGQPWASIRAHVWFQNVTTSLYRDVLFNATRTRMCLGGYVRSIYVNVDKLMVDNGLIVGHNNGSRCPRNKQTNRCTVGWIPYADPNNPNCKPSSPSPSPKLSPTPSPSPSPSPSPKLSPSPSPSPAPVTTIFTAVTDVVVAPLPGGCDNPQVVLLHNQILEDYTRRLLRRLPSELQPFLVTFKLPCQEIARRRRLLQELDLLLPVGSNTTRAGVAATAVSVGESTEFQSDTTERAEAAGTSVVVIDTNVTTTNGTFNPSSPTPSPSPTGCLPTQLPLFRLQNGELEPFGCSDGTTCENTATLRAGATPNGGPAIGCLIATECPLSYRFSWFVAPASGRSPVVKECWQENGGNANCDGLPFSTFDSVVEMAATLTAVTSANLRGCTVATAPGGPAFCPGGFRFFAASATGTLPNPVAGQSSCFTLEPSCGDSVPVIDSPNAGATGPVIGCLGTTPQLPQATCPAQIPQVLSLQNNFTFFLTAGTGTGGATSCRRRSAGSSCAPFTTARKFTDAIPDGCFTGNLILCPATSSYSFPMLGPIAGGSAPVLQQCSTPPGGTTCNPAGGVYTVPVSTDGGLDGVPTAIRACQTPTASCPSAIGGIGGSYPLINAAGIITDCRSPQTACPDGWIPLCSSTGVVPPDAKCPAASTMGCVAPGAPRNVACYSTPDNRYPTVDGFPVFAVALTPAATLEKVAGCFSTATGCSTAAASNTTFSITAQTNGAFSGCTNQNVPTCTTWWSGQVGSGGLCVA